MTETAQIIVKQIKRKKIKEYKTDYRTILSLHTILSEKKFCLFDYI